MTEQRRKGPPAKGLLGAVLVIAYWLLVPTLNAKFGWNLPELRGGTASQTASVEGDDPATISETATQTDTPTRTSTVEQSSRTAQSSAQTSTAEATPVAAESSSTEASPAALSLEELALTYLKETGPERYLSPGGLLYGPGSEEGHRLKHIARHLQDSPSRPGSHGVFEGDLVAFLKVIDEAYKRVQDDGAGVSTEVEDGRTVHTVNLGRRIGYVGGREGERRRNPAARSLRIVVSGNRLITAFPL